jgi:cytochrome c peroxidase
VRASFLASSVALALTACSEDPIRERAPRAAAVRGAEETVAREPLEPLPAATAEDPRTVALGRRLFHDKRLSSDGTISCASCHDLANGGDDGRARSLGVGGKEGGVNAPTVLNAALNFALFWNGRAQSLEEQAGGPITNPLEMNAAWPAIVSKLGREPAYAAAFKESFPDGVTAENVKRAIATYERTLITRGAAFDKWLAGDAGALSADQKAGYELFKSAGCVACHQGRNVGGNMFQRFGILGDYFKDRGHVTEADFGRFGVTKNESDRFVFRVPSLRNVEKTAPYFHDGSAATLDRAVQVMAKYQLGRALTEEQVAQIVAFLKSLTGPLPDGALEKAG